MRMRSCIAGAALAAAGTVTVTALPAAAATTPVAMTTRTVAAVIKPNATDRNIYVSQTGCEIAGYWGQYWGAWTWFLCQPIYFQGEDQPWWQLVTFP